jgi:hypothetical protein
MQISMQTLKSPIEYTPLVVFVVVVVAAAAAAGGGGKPNAFNSWHYNTLQLRITSYDDF